MAEKLLFTLLIFCCSHPGVGGVAGGGARGVAGGGALHIYTSVGQDVSMPCTNARPPGCSSTTWSFCEHECASYVQGVTRGQVEVSARKAERLSLGPGCSLQLHNARPEDAGIYFCMQQTEGPGPGPGRPPQAANSSNVYLAVLSASSSTALSELRPGGTLVLSCLLATHYNAWSCKPKERNAFSLAWVAGDRNTSSYTTSVSPCNVTLVVVLQQQDHGRMWRCEVTTGTPEGQAETFLEFRSTFFLHREQHSGTEPTDTMPCAEFQLPVWRVVYCVSLPVVSMVAILIASRQSHRSMKAHAAGIY